MRHRPVSALRVGLLSIVLGGALTFIPTARTEAQGAGTHIHLVSQTPWVQPTGDEFVLRFTVDSPPPDATLVFRMYPRIVNGRNRFLDTIHATDKLGPPDRTFKALPLANLPVDSAGVFTARFTADARTTPLLGFLLESPGVYPLVMEIRNPSGDEVARIVTHVIRLPFAKPSPNPPFAAAIVVPIRAPVAHLTDGSVNLGDQARVLGERIAVLGRHDGVPVTLAATPETIAALHDTSAVADTALTGLADRRQVVDAPYVDLDLASWVAPDNPHAMQADLDRELDAGSATLTTLLGVAPDRRTALIDKTTTVDALTKLRSRGAEQVVVPESLLFPLPEKDFPRTLTRRFLIEGPAGTRTRAVMADSQLVGHIGDSDDPVLNAAHTVADLAILYDDQPALARGAVLELPDDVPPAYLDALLGALASPSPASAPGQQILAASTVGQLFTTSEEAGDRGGQTIAPNGSILEPPLVRAWFPDPPAGLGTYPRQLALAHGSLTSYRTMFADGDTRVLPLEQLLLLSAARELNPKQRQDQLDAAVATVEAVAQRVVIPPQPEVTLTATDGHMPFSIDNTGSDALIVRLTLTSDKLEFPGGRTQVVTLRPGTNRIDLPVRARGSGLFTVNAAITSPDGTLPMASTRFDMRSTAVSGLGLAISVASGIFLAVWWARHIHRERRSRRSAPPVEPPVAASEPVPV